MERVILGGGPIALKPSAAKGLAMLAANEEPVSRAPSKPSSEPEVSEGNGWVAVLAWLD